MWSSRVCSEGHILFHFFLGGSFTQLIKGARFNWDQYTKTLFIQYQFIRNSSHSGRVPKEKRKFLTVPSVSGREACTGVPFWRPQLYSAQRIGDCTECIGDSYCTVTVPGLYLSTVCQTSLVRHSCLTVF